MKQITQKLNVAINNYQPGEFLPIYIDGALANRKEFVRYKMRCFLVKRTLI